MFATLLEFCLEHKLQETVRTRLEIYKLLQQKGLVHTVSFSSSGFLSAILDVCNGPIQIQLLQSSALNPSSNRM